MSVLDMVNEGSTKYLMVEFRDKNGNVFAPNTVVFDVECITTGTAIRSNIGMTPAAQVEIVLSSFDNAIINEANPFELRRVSVRCGFGASENINDQYEYWVRNMSKV